MFLKNLKRIVGDKPDNKWVRNILISFPYLYIFCLFFKFEMAEHRKNQDVAPQKNQDGVARKLRSGSKEDGSLVY